MAERNTVLTKEDIGFDIKVTWLAISRMFSPQAAEHNMTVTMGFVLLNIDRERGTPATKIAPILGMEPRSLTRLIKKMVEGGLVVRRPDPEDRRSIRIFLTDKGFNKKLVTKQSIEFFNMAVRERLSDEELSSFFGVLDKIHQVIKEKTK